MTNKRFLFILIIFLIISQYLFSVFHKVGGIHVETNIATMEIENNLAFIGTYNNDLMIYDISSLNSPILISSLLFHNLVRNIEIDEDYCYAQVGDTTIVVINISDIQSPNIINEFSYSTVDIKKICILDDTIFIALQNRLQIINIRDAQNPELLSSCTIPVSSSSLKCLSIKNNFALVGTNNGVYIYDITDHLNPYLLTLFELSYVKDIEIYENYVYISHTDGLKVVNIDNPENIQIIGEFSEFWLNNLSIDNNFLYATGGISYYGDLYCFDISDLSNIFIYGEYAEVDRIVKVQDEILYAITTLNYQSSCTFVDVSDVENQYFLGSDIYACYSGGISIKNNLLGIRNPQYNSSIILLDISNPQSPEWIYSYSYGYNMELYASTVTFYDNFVITGFRGSYYDNSRFIIHDTRDITNITPLGEIDVYSSSIYEIAVKENYAYVGCDDDLKVFDINDLSDPFYVCNINCAYVNDIEIRDNFLYLTDYNALIIIDISDPEESEILGNWESENSARALNVFGNYVYISDNNGGVKVIDVSNPMNPFLVNTVLPHYNSIIYAKPIIQNDKLIISDVCWNEILVYDLTYPAYPILINSFKWNLPSHEIATTDEYLVAANGRGGFTILDMENLTPTFQNIIQPEGFALKNFPNPFNPGTTIVFSIEQNQQHEQATIEIYNIKGQKIKKLEIRNAKFGINEIVWNGNDDSNKRVSSGIYLYKLILNGKTEAVSKCLLLK
ncbi:MAG: T9SS type A sorting domain-containing protein [Candidatus Cloacimonetes bacterium]|nr:T9SS type A sorting domain-containing protein [Candidatus Cloacimonadota bacterium]